MVVGLLAIPFLVAVNGFFVAAEFALVSIRPTRVEELVNDGRAGASALLHAITDLDRSVAACQLGITVASLALGFVSEPAVHHLIRPLLDGLPPEWARVLSIVVTLGLITYMHVVFGEQMPKLAALQNSNTKEFIFGVPHLLWFLSQVVTLEPGDLIFTGTPPGVGIARKPPVLLKPGDVAEVEIEGIGTLKNPVVAES